MSWTNKGRSMQKSRPIRDEKDSYYFKIEETKKDSFYDSGTDSGILSGSNLVSDTCFSGEIFAPPERSDGGSCGDKTDSNKGLDSGVDITDQLSSLDIYERERLNDLSSDNQGSKSSGYSHNIPIVRVENTDKIPWEHYFQRDEDGDSSLHIAVITNKFKDLLTLVQMIPDPKYLDIRNDMRQTALHLAVLTSQEKMVKLLVAAGAATDSVDHHGNTPLHLATAAGDLELVKELTLPPPENTVESIRLKYKPPTRPPVLPEINMYNYEGLACVHLALMGGNIAVLKHLTWYGANINAGELKGGLTPIHMASTKGDVGLVKTLVRELEADPCPLTYGGQSPYSLARESSMHSNMASCLSELGSSCLGDSEEEDEDHLAAHYYSDSEDEDVQMVDRSINIRDFHLGVAV